MLEIASIYLSIYSIAELSPLNSRDTGHLCLPLYNFLPNFIYNIGTWTRKYKHSKIVGIPLLGTYSCRTLTGADDNYDRGSLWH